MISLDRPAAQKLLKILEKKSARAGEHALQFDTTALPFAVRSSYSGYARYELEIGCGWGEFTRENAALCPETFFLAIEKKLARVKASSHQQKASNIKNLRYLVLDVAWFFGGVFKAQEFDAITINFPDPWPKLRHHKHRFITPALAVELARITTPQAKFTFASDDYRYARECMEVFESSTSWQNTLTPFGARNLILGRPQSFFEKLHRAEGATIYFLEYTKKALVPKP